MLRHLSPKKLRAVQEQASLFASPYDIDLTGFELPVEFGILPSGYGYIAIYTFSDDNFLTLLLWERAMRQFIQAGVPGIVIDMRVNGGGSPDISNVMLGYLFDEETYTGTSAYYFPDLDAFEFDPLYDQVIYPDDELYFDGDIRVIVSPTCYSACEFFSYTLTLRDNVEIIGYLPTGGLGGGIKQFAMPGDVSAQFTVGRAVGADNEIHIEGTGVAPTIVVPRSEENLFSDGDPLLDVAVESLE
jgi:C-terminal processing protease CtpA/Prc